MHGGEIPTAPPRGQVNPEQLNLLGLRSQSGSVVWIQERVETHGLCRHIASSSPVKRKEKGLITIFW